MHIHPGCLAQISCIYSPSWRPFVDYLLCAAVLGVLELPIHWARHASCLNDSTGRCGFLFNSSCEKTSLGPLLKGTFQPQSELAVVVPASNPSMFETKGGGLP